MRFKQEGDHGPGPSIAVEHLGRVTTTMGVARRRIGEGLVGPRMFVASSQSGGYGRRGAPWHSPEGGLWCTAAWPLNGAPAPDAAWLRAACACLRTVDALLGGRAGDRTRVKLPNDVLIDDRKVCGCLCEVVRSAGGWLLVGVGMNVNNDPRALPGDLARPPTALAHEAGSPIDLAHAAGVLAMELSASLARMSKEEALRAVAPRLWRLDEEVELAQGDGGPPLRGVLRGLTGDGLPVLERDGVRTAAPAGWAERPTDGERGPGACASC